MNKNYKIFLLLLIVVFAISSYFFIKEMAENNKEKNFYTDLQTMVYTDQNNNEETKENDTTNYDLKDIYDLNYDLIGWIKIDGTNIDYPVMQNEDYYLYRNIYKEYSSHGTPYLADSCNIETSDNLVIYGHHMNDNSMFSQLDDYKKYEFYKKHKFIRFYTFENNVTEENIYEIVAVFKTVVYKNDSFQYYKYVNFFDEESFLNFRNKCNDLKLYNTDSTMNFNDTLITLSTCEYSQKNGRIVIIAKKI